MLPDDRLFRNHGKNVWLLVVWFFFFHDASMRHILQVFIFRLHVICAGHENNLNKFWNIVVLHSISIARDLFWARKRCQQILKDHGTSFKSTYDTLAESTTGLLKFRFCNVPDMRRRSKKKECILHKNECSFLCSNVMLCYVYATQK